MKKNNWKKGATLLGLTVAMLTLSLHVAKADESSINGEIENFQKQLNSELSQTNAIYAKANDSQTKLKATQAKIDSLTTEIAKTEDKHDSLKARVAEQMRATQSKGGVSTSVIDIILNATDFHEAIQALTSLQVILHAENTQAKDLVNTQKNLEDMQNSLLDSKKELVATQADYQKKVENLEDSIANLKNKVAENQDILAEMKAKAEQEKIEKAEKEASEPKIETLSAVKTDEEEVSAEDSSASSTDSSTMTEPSAETGSTLTVSATAYSSDNGLGFITATGINLHQNPMCIAVDPSVIPLGSMVEVPGYGIAIAGDTGGAIVGNIIDVHFPTTAQAQAWGRKTIQVNVLS
ncbi:3D domain-containing protein [Lactococcus garvieae]|uniref:3D domain-containing protein n=1 Tax=Lactococcus garvieae TaxID=1363 RepID=UPI0009BD688E|nr:3D domain-containing protein [Lactococcus garvieae]QPS70561.1 hypothetical protein I6G50_07310 [Lactococcus garvieae]